MQAEDGVYHVSYRVLAVLTHSFDREKLALDEQQAYRREHLNASPFAILIIHPGSPAHPASCSLSFPLIPAYPPFPLFVYPWLSRHLVENPPGDNVFYQLHTASRSFQPGLQERSLSAVLRSFYSSLFTLVMPDFERLRRPGTRGDARRSTALLVADAHELVFRLVSREDSGYTDRSFLLHTPDQVSVDERAFWGGEGNQRDTPVALFCFALSRFCPVCPPLPSFTPKLSTC